MSNRDNLTDDALRKQLQHKVSKLKQFYQSIVLFIGFVILFSLNHYFPDLTSSSISVIALLWLSYLIYQGVHLFGNFWIFAPDWEEKQIKKFMEQDDDLP